MAKVVLACHIYIADDWYGDRHRIILTKESGEGFDTKTEAKKFTVRLRKYAQKRFGKYRIEKITNDNIVCRELDMFKPYIYVSLGPSLFFTHHTISTADLMK